MIVHWNEQKWRGSSRGCRQCASASVAIAATELARVLAEHATGLSTFVLAVGFPFSLLAWPTFVFGAKKIRTLSRIPGLIIHTGFVLNFASMIVLSAILFPPTTPVSP